MKVLKFGGSSVGNSKRIKKVIDIVHSNFNSTSPLVAIVSAVEGVTEMIVTAANKAVKGDKEYKNVFKIIEKKHMEIFDTLIAPPYKKETQEKLKKFLVQLEQKLLGVEYLKDISEKSIDMLMSFGEKMSTLLISYAYQSLKKKKCFLVDAEKLVKTDSFFGKAKINFTRTNAHISSAIKENKIYFVAGFIASNQLNETTTLGRGGSDYSASIFGAALDAEQIEIWSDVDGIMTADPKIVPNAVNVKTMSYEEAIELSYFGSKVIYSPTMEPARKKNISIRIKNSFNPKHPGTLISNKAEKDMKIVKGLSGIGNVCVVTITCGTNTGGMEVAKRVFGTLNTYRIAILLATQGSSDQSLTIVIHQDILKQTKRILENEFQNDIQKNMISPISYETDLAIVSVIGNGMKSKIGLSGKIFGVLGHNGINVKIITQGSSERNISLVTNNNQLKKAVNLIHDRFFSESKKTAHLFIAGIGNVGGALIEQIKNQRHTLIKKLKMELKVVGISTSKKMIFDENGISLNDVPVALTHGEEANIQKFIAKSKELNLRNTIFLDITASSKVAQQYRNILNHKISIVAANKIACSSKYSDYLSLKKHALDNNISFLYETNVGAGLPVLSTLNNIVQSGDKVISIEAVVSGSLNFIFNTYLKGGKMMDAVKTAMQKGFTEPDPRIDLSGKDVMRKLMILVRESGFSIEEEAFKVEEFLPDSCTKEKSVQDFLDTLEREETYFDNMRKKVLENKQVIRYVGQFSDGKVKLGLKFPDKTSMIYDLQGSDNIILIYTHRYKQLPLVIKGAGAGPHVTASGVFSDVIATVNFLN